MCSSEKEILLKKIQNEQKNNAVVLEDNNKLKMCNTKLVEKLNNLSS